MSPFMCPLCLFHVHSLPCFFHFPRKKIQLWRWGKIDVFWYMNILEMSFSKHIHMVLYILLYFFMHYTWKTPWHEILFIWILIWGSYMMYLNFLILCMRDLYDNLFLFMWCMYTNIIWYHFSWSLHIISTDFMMKSGLFSVHWLWSLVRFSSISSILLIWKNEVCRIYFKCVFLWYWLFL